MRRHYQLSSYLLSAAIVCGAVVYSGFIDRAHDSDKGSLARSESVFPTSDGEVPGRGRVGYLVQEPSDRTALLPGFSNPARKSSQRDSVFVLTGFREAVGDAWKSTVEIIEVDSQSDRQIALGAIVDSEGWIVTKASQLTGEAGLVCRLFDGRESKVSLVSTAEEHDLALLRIGYKQLPTVNWSATGAPARGKWVATTYLNPTPAAVGVVSAGVQSVSRQKPILGVELADSSSGASVSRVLAGSGADQAGLRVNDIIHSVDGATLGDSKALMARIERCKAGQQILIGITRGQRKMQISARLMDLAEELLDPTELEVNGSISARRTGFSRVYLHDTVLSPNQCGGPLVDLDGRVVGINIARAGRVTSYALPVDAARPMITQMLSSAKSTGHTDAAK